jgi:hypothetical protein
MMDAFLNLAGFGARLGPSGERVTMFRPFAALAPAALWAIYFIVLAIAYNVGWPIELAVGVGVVSSMMTLIGVYLMIPTPMRLAVDEPAPVAPVVEAPVPTAGAGVNP